MEDVAALEEVESGLAGNSRNLTVSRIDGHVRPLHEHPHGFVVATQVDRLLPVELLIGGPDRDAVSIDHHEAESGVQQVQVDRMEPATTVVLEVPDLIVSGAWRGVINIHVEEIAIDREAAAGALEAELSKLCDLGRRGRPALFACAQIVGN